MEILFFIALASYIFFSTNKGQELFGDLIPNSKSSVYKRISKYLEDNKFNELDSFWYYTNENSWCYISVNKKNFYLNTRISYKNSKPEDVEGIFEYSDITWSEIKLQTEFNQKIIKSDFLKKSLIGGLTFGAKGAFIGALLTGIKEEELITHVTLYLKIKNVKETIGLVFWQYHEGMKPKYAEYLIEKSKISEFYSYLVEQDFSGNNKT